MKLPRYPIAAGIDDYTYLFYSEGPKGKIAKAVVYKQIGKNLYNLAFGDWDEENKELDDSIRSNNGDRDKILATVAFTALKFATDFPDGRIYVEGSNAARTRLYQMGITANLLEINEKFKIQGLFNDSWESFQKNRNYDSFLFSKK